MKNIKFLLSGAVVALMLSSCDGVNSGSGNITKELDTDEQKEKLEQVGVKLMDQCPADEFQKYFDLAEQFEDAYMTDDYDVDALVDFAGQSEEKAFSEEVTAVYNEINRTYTKESVCNLAVVLSNHKGEFTFGSDGVVLVDTVGVDGTKVNFTLNGKNYVAQIKSSEKTTRAFYSYSDYYKSNHDWGYTDEYGDYIYFDDPITSVYDYVMTFSIDVPEKVEVSLTENGKSMGSIELNFTQSFTAAGLNPSTDNINVSASVVIDNGYEMVLNKFAYDGKTSTAGTSVMFKKDGLTLISGEASGSVQIENYTEEYSQSYGEGRYTSAKVTKAKDVEISIDFLGEVQFKGSSSNVKELSESLEAYWDALSTYDDNGHPRTPDESAALRHLNNVNAKLDLNVYYDGGSNSQAKVEFEMDKYQYDWDSNYDGLIDAKDVDYDLAYVIVFNDGSRYSIEEYFDEASFSALIDKSESFADDYEDLLGIYAKEEELRGEINNL